MTDVSDRLNELIPNAADARGEGDRARPPERNQPAARGRTRLRWALLAALVVGVAVLVILRVDVAHGHARVDRLRVQDEQARAKLHTAQATLRATRTRAAEGEADRRTAAQQLEASRGRLSASGVDPNQVTATLHANERYLAQLRLQQTTTAKHAEALTKAIPVAEACVGNSQRLLSMAAMGHGGPVPAACASVGATP